MTFNIDNTVPKFIFGDDQHLAQVITNLLSNAVKFTPENGEIKLLVSLASCNEVSRARERGRLPIIAITANAYKDDIKNCLEAGMDDHISKPLDVEKIFEILRSYLY